MDTPEFTLSPETSAEMAREFQQFRREKIDGKPLAEWLRGAFAHAKVDSMVPGLYIPTILRSRLAATMDKILSNARTPQGLPQGREILQAFDGIIHENGAPELLIHGLPTDEDIAPIIHEALRLRMSFDPTQPYRAQMRLEDKPEPKRKEGFKHDGHRYWHVDNSDIGMTFAETEGSNPRYSGSLMVPEFLDQVTHWVKKSWPDATSRSVAELMKKPIWPVAVTQPKAAYEGDALAYETDRTRDAQRLAKAQNLGLTRTVKGVVYAPLIYDNPTHTPQEKNSQPYKILDAPFEHFWARLRPNTSQLSGDEAYIAEDIAREMLDLRKEAEDRLQKDKKGRILKPGSAWIFNNRLMFHFGGAFLYDELPEHVRNDTATLKKRAINTIDVCTAVNAPKRELIKPILWELLEPKIEPATIKH